MCCDLLLCVTKCCYWDYVLLCAAMWQSVANWDYVLLLWLCVTMCYYVTICCYLWLCVIVCCYCDYVLLCDNVLLCVTICCYWDYVLLCAAMWQSVPICDNLLLSVTICFYVREWVGYDCVSMCDNVLWFAAMFDDVLLLWLCVTMRCYTTICCYFWLSGTVCCHCDCVLLCAAMWQSVAICDNVLLCVTICFNVRKCVACDRDSMCDNVSWFSAMCDDVRCVAIGTTCY
jgi:hypothetical protein